MSTIEDNPSINKNVKLFTVKTQSGMDDDSMMMSTSTDVLAFEKDLMA